MAKISKIVLLEQPEQRVLSIRTTINMNDLSNVAEQAYDKIIEYLTQIGELTGGAPYVCYYNEDLENLDVEIGFPVAKTFQGTNEIAAHTIPVQKVLAGIHLGAYVDSDPLFYEMMQWLNDNGYQTQGTIYNYYLNDSNRPENELLTKIVIPIKGA
jgi:effector-binding domain-containing protein